MAKASKGGQFEREVSKFLTKWLTGQCKEYFFWRSPSSGGVSTILPENIEITGDIISLKPESKLLLDKYTIECKNGYPKGDLNCHVKYNKSDPIKSFWEQCNLAAVSSHRNPMLIYKKKGLHPWTGICNKSFKKLYKYLQDLRFVHINYPKEDLPDIYFYDMKEFFTYITPDVIKKMRK